MSRCRFGEADIYLYDDVGGYINCCACSLTDAAFGSTHLHGVDEALAHIAAHRSAGDDVPAFVSEELEADRRELTAWLSGVTR